LRKLIQQGDCVTLAGKGPMTAIIIPSLSLIRQSTDGTAITNQRLTDN
jgi:hypothetical protein